MKFFCDKVIQVFMLKHRSEIKCLNKTSDPKMKFLLKEKETSQNLYGVF